MITHTPKRNYEIMQISVPEAVLQMDTEETIFSEPVDTEDYHAMGIGPGLGTAFGFTIALLPVVAVAISHTQISVLLFSIKAVLIGFLMIF